MLVLERSRGETIRIGDDIVITIVEIRHTGKAVKVRVGIDAPKSVSVHRQEVYDAIQAEQQTKETNNG